jgi:spore germination protein YaaH
VAALALVGLLAGLIVPVRPAAAEPRSPLVAGWLPTWATDAAVAGVEANAAAIGSASPFWYQAKAANGSVSITTSLSESTRATVLARLRAAGVEIIPSVADGSAARAMAAILKSSSARTAHVAQLVSLATSNGFDGIELDYEKFAFSDGSSTWPQTRPAWVAFITELGTALHAAGKKLAVAVPPMYDGTYTSSSGYWVYDYAGMAPSVDSLRIMTYDFSVSRPGPIAPLSFLRRTLSYAVSAFPAERIRMGVPAYGRLWTARTSSGAPSITGTCPVGAVPGTKSFTTTTALSYLTSVAGQTPALRYDDVTAEMVATFAKEYTGTDKDGKATSCVVDHEAWWVDARGVAARLPLVTEYGLAGVAIWHLGGVDADSWSVIRSAAAGEPVVTPAPPPPPPPALTTPTVKLKPSTLRPRPGQKVKFRVRITPATAKVKVKRKARLNGSWRTLAVKRTNAKGKARFTFRWPKSETSLKYRVITKKRGSLGPGRSAKIRLTSR